MKLDNQMASSPQQKKAKSDASDGANKSGGDASVDMSDIISNVDMIQAEVDKLNEQASEEILKVEQKYNKLRQPVYSRRNEVLEQLPHFWLTVFVNHPQIGSLLSERDEQLLRHLKRLEVTEFEDIKSGFKISFHFESNPFFSDSVISREVHMSETGEPTVTSSTIHWHPGQDWTKKKNAGSKRTHEEDDEPLFLMLLSNEPQDQSMEDIAEIIKDDIWPNPMQYFMSDESREEDDDEVEGEVDEGDGEGEDVEAEGEGLEEGIEEGDGDEDDAEGEDEEP